MRLGCAKPLIVCFRKLTVVLLTTPSHKVKDLAQKREAFYLRKSNQTEQNRGKSKQK